MNTTAIPARQLICLLTGTAAGQAADLAAVELIARHNHFLHQPAFRRVITGGASILSGEPVVTIRWQAAITALEAGRLHATGSERAVLRIAASIGNPGIPVHLREVLGGLDHRNITLVTAAITAANS